MQVPVTIVSKEEIVKSPLEYVTSDKSSNALAPPPPLNRLVAVPPSVLKYKTSLFTYKVPYPLAGVSTSPLSFITKPSPSNIKSPVPVVAKV